MYNPNTSTEQVRELPVPEHKLSTSLSLTKKGSSPKLKKVISLGDELF